MTMYVHLSSKPTADINISSDLKNAFLFVPEHDDNILVRPDSVCGIHCTAGNNYDSYWDNLESDQTEPVRPTTTRYVKLQVAHAPGMPGTFSPATKFKGNC